MTQDTYFSARIDHLIATLSNLAALWAGVYGDDDLQAAYVHEYHAAVAELFELEWDDRLTLECELPRHLMPEIYLQRHPDFNRDVFVPRNASTHP
jgi:hypothetical protein